MAGASSKQNPYPGAVLNSKISTSYIEDFDDTQIVGSIDRSSGAHHNGLSGEAAARTLAPTSAAASGRRKAALRPPRWLAVRSGLSCRGARWVGRPPRLSANWLGGFELRAALQEQTRAASDGSSQWQVVLLYALYVVTIIHQMVSCSTR